MATPVQRPIEVFRVHPGTLWVTVFAALLLQVFLPVKLTLAQLFDFPLLVTIYFALLRRNKVFGIGLGAGLGLTQDALSHGFIGIFGMTKALVGYLAASASVKFDLEQVAARFALTAVFVFVHGGFLLILQHGLLESAPPFRPWYLLSGILINVGLGLILFHLLDRFKKPA